MPTTSGATIGPYKVDREIGRGGMGVVFLAHDTRLGRTVALKALPEDVASDPDRLERFELEARVLASLNHPNVAAIYGLEVSGGHRYLALEHVEGETLADKLSRGPLSLQETLDICIEIAAGMEAAHDAGVVHRDLKPSNVMITPNDQVKVLDFGLAKGRVATDESGLAKSPTFLDSPTTPSSPTLTSPAVPHSPTLPGVILGTAAYLSPEQARGKVVDRRTDIWSFGCVLYECLTGKHAFQGETTSDTIAKVLERDADWSALPKHTPPRLRELLERCLTKDPKRRLRDIGDAHLALEDIKSGRHPDAGADADAGLDGAASQRRSAIIAGVVALVVGIALGALSWNALGPAGRRGNPGMTHLALSLPANTLPIDGVVTPDGKNVFLLAIPHAPGEDTRPRLYLRRMDQESFVPVAGTEGATPGLTASPDSRWVVFRAPASEQSTRIRILKMPVDGSSPPVAITDASDGWSNEAAWLESGDLFIATDNGTRYVRVPTGSGTPTPPRKFDAPGFDGRFTPQRLGLPGDRGVLLDAVSYEGGVFRQGVSVLDLKSGKVKSLLRDGGSPVYLPPGYLLFTRQDALFAVPFDVGSLRIKGEPVALIGGLRQRTSWTHAGYDLTPNGTLLYVAGGKARVDRHLVVFGRDGTATDWSGDRRAFEYWLAISPDGNRCLTSINSADAITEIWITERGRGLRRLPTRPGADCMGAVWSPDGRYVAYYESSLSPKDGVYIAAVDGSAPLRFLAAPRSKSEIMVPTSWSPDRSWIALSSNDGGKLTVLVVPVPPASGAPAVPRPLFPGEQRGGGCVFSPDGRKVAYFTRESGQLEVAVRGWANGAVVGEPLFIPDAQVSVPRWSPDSKHVFFRSAREKIVDVEITEASRLKGSTPRLSASEPRALWDLVALRIAVGSPGGALYDILPDGRLLAVQSPEGEDVPTQAEVLLNVTDEIEKRMHAAGK
ncbi:MAG TPA: protein kinase [Candidatus Eisenbacteria bacterium]|jgi:serine/threonine-protein kinase